MGHPPTTSHRVKITGVCATLAVLSGAAVTGGYGFLAAGDQHLRRGCALPHCFNVATSAGRLSEFAGVLTALTFSAIVFLLDRKRVERAKLRSTVILFTTAFVSLIFATYLYTDGAAEELPSFRAAAVSFAASVALGVALLQLFLGIAHMVREQGDSTFFVRLACWFVGPTIFYFLMASAVNAWGLEMASRAEWHSPLARGTEILLTIWLFGALLPWPVFQCMRLKVWATVSVVAVGVATLFVGYWGEEARFAPVSPGAYFGAMVVLLVLGLGYSSLLKRAFGGKPPSPSTNDYRTAATRAIPHTFEEWPP